MVLLAVCDAHYNITGIDIGKYGSNNYYGVLLKSEQNCLNMLSPKTLDGLDETVPFFLVGDEILHRLRENSWPIFKFWNEGRV